MKVKSLSRVRLLATPWTAAYQAPPSMGFSRQEYWSGVPLPSPPNVTTFPQTDHFSFSLVVLCLEVVYVSLKVSHDDVFLSCLSSSSVFEIMFISPIDGFIILNNIIKFCFLLHQL